MKFPNDCDADSVTKIKQIFDNLFLLELKRTKKFSIFDLRDEKNKYFIEVKKRNNLHNKYPETIIGVNKFIKAKEYFNKGYSIYFCFEFLDGIYYYKYINEELIIKKGKFDSRNNNIIKDHVFIDIKKLQKI